MSGQGGGFLQVPGGLAVTLAAVLLGCAGNPPPPPSAPARVQNPDPSALHVGGSGAMTPLAMRLAEAWAARGGQPAVVVAESIGTGGGVRAAADGALDLGLASRPLTPEELRLGLTVLPAGRDVVVLAAHPSVPVEGLSSNELLALHRGQMRHFPDGTPAVLLLRDRAESANRALDLAVPGIRQAREEAYRERRHRVLYHDSAMAEALRATRGALGVFPLGAIVSLRLPLRILALDGVHPSPENVESGRWRMSRPLLLVARPDCLPRAAAFLRFLYSAEAAQLYRASGYLPPAAPPEGAP